MTTSPQEQGPHSDHEPVTGVEEQTQVVIEEARRNPGGSPPDVVHAALVTELEARGLVLDTSVVAEATRDISEHRSHQVEGEAGTRS